jgi:plasmid stabilization system protein ParE
VKKRRRPFEIGFMTGYMLLIRTQRDDLHEVWDYIAADNPDAADRVLAKWGKGI